MQTMIKQKVKPKKLDTEEQVAKNKGPKGI